MTNENDNILDEVADYYAKKLEQHGETARGVDWNGQESQFLRFEQLSKIITTKDSFSINDLGCGFGSLYDYLDKNHQNFSYVGIDISREMVLAAKQRNKDKNNAHFYVGKSLRKAKDYCLASGIFNVRLQQDNKTWLRYIYKTLDILDEFSVKGFSFNCLTSYSDEDKQRDNLYYADPCIIFDYCKRYFSRNVTLLHDYDLYEFTILVRK